MVYIIVYLLFLLSVLVVLYRKVTGVRSEEYIIYGRSGGVLEITMSLVALVFGASSVFGLSGWGYRLGWNAIWWTLSGVVFLVLLGAFLTKTIYSFRGFTIIDIIEKNFGNSIKLVSSFILLVAWVSILAGQIIAGGNITQLILGDRTLSIFAFILILGVYTVIWGQVGAIKTSPFQVVLMLFGLGTILYLAFSKVTSPVELLKNAEFGFNDNFPFSLWLSVLLSVGLSYFFGPDIYSRVFSSKDYRTAKISLFISSGFIFVISAVIVSIGIISKGILEKLENPENVIPMLSLFLTPEELKPLVLIALISIPLSGADVILITSVSTLSKNIFPLIFGERDIFNKVWFTRVMTILVILTAGLLSVWHKGIIPALLVAYKIFSSAIAPLILTSILARLLRKGIYLSGVKRIIILSSLALTSTYIVLAETIIPSLGVPNYTLYLLVINLLVTLTSIRFFQSTPDEK